MIMSMQKILLNELFNTGEKCRSFGVNNMAISPILMSNDKIIKKVNQEISSMSAANGFHFICDDITDVSLISKIVSFSQKIVQKC